METIDLLNGMINEPSAVFKESTGVRSKTGLNGRHSIFEVLKFFDMPIDLRDTVENCLDEKELELALEVYFLRFKQGGFLDDTKMPWCYYTCKAILLTDKATVFLKGEKYEMVKGDALEIPIKELHSVENAPSQTDFLVLMQIR